MKELSQRAIDDAIYLMNVFSELQTLREIDIEALAKSGGAEWAGDIRGRVEFILAELEV